MVEWVEKEEYQNWADVIRSEQVPISRVIQVMEVCDQVQRSC